MKRIFTLLIGLLFTYSLSSQTVKQRLDSLLGETYLTGEGRWYYNTKEEFLYNNENLVQHFYYQGSPDEWYVYSKEEYTYNENNSLSHLIIFNHNLGASNWNYEKMYEYTYDISGNVIQEIYSFWDINNEEWITNSKKQNTYNNGKLSECLTLKWNVANSSWDNSSKTEYTFDNEGFVNEGIKFIWDDQWVNNFKHLFTHDSKGNLTSRQTYSWNVSTEQWELILKYEFNYDVLENLTSDVYYQWSDDLNALEEYWKYEYNYNDTYSIENLIIPETFSRHFYIKHMLTDYIMYDWDTEVNEFISTHRLSYYYSEQAVTGITNPIEFNFRMYPNPADDFITFDIEDKSLVIIEIYDIKGTKVLEKKAIGKTIIPVNNLVNGLYLYKLTQDSKCTYGKIVIK